MELEMLDHVALTVTEVEEAAQWYEDVLGLRRVFAEEWGDYPAMLVAGSTGVALFPTSAAETVGDGSRRRAASTPGPRTNTHRRTPRTRAKPTSRSRARPRR